MSGKMQQEEFEQIKSFHDKNYANTYIREITGRSVNTIRAVKLADDLEDYFKINKSFRTKKKPVYNVDPAICIDNSHKKSLLQKVISVFRKNS